MAKMIQVNELRLIRLNVDQNPFGSAEADVPATQEIDFDTYTAGEKERANHVLMVLRVKGETETKKGMLASASYEVHGVAEFETPDGLNPAQRRGMVMLNGGMILYGMLRGQVSLITGAFPGGSIVLPAVDWKATVEKITKKPDEAASSPRSQPAKSPPPPSDRSDEEPAKKSAGRKSKAASPTRSRKPRAK